MNGQSGPCVLFWLPSDSTNHPQMLWESGREEGKGRDGTGSGTALKQSGRRGCTGPPKWSLEKWRKWMWSQLYNNDDLKLLVSFYLYFTLLDLKGCWSVSFYSQQRFDLLRAYWRMRPGTCRANKMTDGQISLATSVSENSSHTDSVSQCHLPGRLRKNRAIVCALCATWGVRMSAIKHLLLRLYTKCTHHRHVPPLCMKSSI